MKDMRDTDPKVEEMWHQMLMSVSGEKRIRMACGMYGTAMAFVTASLSRHMTDEDPVAWKMAILRRFHGDSIDERTYRGVEQRLRARHS